jgi:crossover junction endodeoxyribonuclease RuvC
MFVMGIDPGLSRCGYGVVRRGSFAEMVALAAGVIETPPSASLPERLLTLSEELTSLMREFRPEAVVVERIFFQHNVRTAMSVGQASGVVMAAAQRCGAAVIQYSPNEVKQSVVGYGSATKIQVQTMVAQILSLREIPQPPDAADALALALCHLSGSGLRGAISAAGAS